MPSSPLAALNIHFPSSKTSTPLFSPTYEVVFVPNIFPSTTHVTMPMPPPIITQTSSLLSTVIGTSASTEPRAMVKKGKKRDSDQSGMDVSVTNQIVWTQQSGELQVDATDIAVALGAFIGANLHAVNTLNMDFDRIKE